MQVAYLGSGPRKQLEKGKGRGGDEEANVGARRSRSPRVQLELSPSGTPGQCCGPCLSRPPRDMQAVPS